VDEAEWPESAFGDSIGGSSSGGQKGDLGRWVSRGGGWVG
jgi:hypothetical protein